MGENLTTRGVDLCGLATGTQLEIGACRIRVTGLRNPCAQLDGIQEGLLSAVLDRDAEGRLVRRAGIMGTVLTPGKIRVGDEIVVRVPEGPAEPLQPV